MELGSREAAAFFRLSWICFVFLGVCGVEVRGEETSEDTDSDRYAWIHAVGNGGIVLKSSNAGLDWKLEDDVGTTENLMDVSFVDARVGVVVGTNSTILHTSNGGLNWNPYTPLEEGFLVTLYGVYINGSPGPVHIVGEKGLFLKTEDGEDWVVSAVSCDAAAETCTVTTGISKAQWESSTATNLYNIRFKDSINGVVVGDAAKVLVTNDGGESFSLLKAVSGSTNSPLPALRALAMDDLGNLAVSGERGAVFHVQPRTEEASDAVTYDWKGCSKDGGCSLAVPTTLGALSRTTDNLLACSLVEDNIVVAGEGGYVAKHSGGAWTNLPLAEGGTDAVTGLYFSTTRTAVAVTRGGKIFRTGNGGSSWAQITGDAIPSGGFSFNGVSGRNAGDISPAARAATASRVTAVLAAGLAVMAQLRNLRV